MLSNVPPIGHVSGAVVPRQQAPTTIQHEPNATSPFAPSRDATRRPRVEVWDQSSGTEQALTGVQISNTGDATIAAAYANAVKVDEFFRSTFGRNGLDNQGMPIRIVVHAPNTDGTPNMNNAYWDNLPNRIYLGDGDGEVFQPLGGALDVMTHEAVHAIVDFEVGMRYGDNIQGGINESFADVIASIADPDDWLIGEDIYTPNTPGDGVRDLAHPRFGNVADIPANAVMAAHEFSGVPSLAAVHVANAIGRSEMGQVWYSALVDHLDPRAGYAGVARATLDAAAAIYGATSSQVGAVRDAWKTVGVEPRWGAAKA